MIETISFVDNDLTTHVEKRDSLPSEYVLKVTNSNDSSEICSWLSE